ncbi:MAG: hypothetical protein P8Z37_04720 [Acidobacteriota bacterium]|jgi:hypothetical protein
MKTEAVMNGMLIENRRGFKSRACIHSYASRRFTAVAVDEGKTLIPIPGFAIRR